MSDDTISRKAAIKALGEEPFAFGEFEQGLHAQWKSNVENIEQLPPTEPERKIVWIPCGERLPEEKDAGILKKLGTQKRSDSVIVTVDVKGERMTDLCCTHDGVWQWKMKYAFPDYKVIAWMPLPEPYKMEVENETL